MAQETPVGEFGHPLIWNRDRNNIAKRKLWNGVATTINGEATFHPTDDDTENGTALFNVICTPIPGVKHIPETPIAFPCPVVKSISEDKKTVIVSVGAGSESAPDGTIVYLFIEGY